MSSDCQLGEVLLERGRLVEMRDGIRLSVDVYRIPDGRARPAVVNCTPYRKDDLDGRSDRANLLFFARRGFVAIKLDVRGTGSSEGVATDEYTEEEQHDYYEVVEWAAAQNWCNGSVGAFGLSYSGFNAIQVAALAPPSLKAIAAIGATDDRYTDDVHFYGGALSAFELGHYQSRMLALNALPPDADLGDQDVRAAWLDRLERTPPWVTRWMTEQRDGPYWRIGSLRPGYERIVCPVLLVVGSHDGYSAATLRTARELQVPWQLIVGPWAHCWPDGAWPGPRFPALETMAGWFDRFLGGDHPSEAQPRTLFFLEEASRIAKPTDDVAGGWYASDEWPGAVRDPLELVMGADGSLQPSSSAEPTQVPVPFVPEVGMTRHSWCPTIPVHLTPDQRVDDGRSLTFTSGEFADDVAVFGEPVVRLRVEHPGPTALVSVKLADVSPDGYVQAVTSGVRNLAHGSGHDAPSAISGTVDVELRLLAASWRFRAGHLVRVSVASSDWPNVWPMPTRDPLVLHLGGGSGTLSLPTAPADGRPFAVPGAPVDMTALGREGGAEVALSVNPSFVISYDSVRERYRIATDDRIDVQMRTDGRKLGYRRSYEATITAGDPLSNTLVAETGLELETPTGTVLSESFTTFTSDESEFFANLELRVRLNGEPLWSRTWNERIPRSLC